MRVALGLLCVAIIMALGFAAWQAVQVRSVLDNSHLLRDPWFVATLGDAYAGFLLFWAWVAWREANPTRAILWLLLILSLGNFATAGYLLLRLWRTRADRHVLSILDRNPPLERA